jgi:surfactin synthase thioesterase subunit
MGRGAREMKGGESQHIVRSIFLFPFGGGSASSYRSYAARFPPDVGQVIPVEIPGRGTRSHEEFAPCIRECAARTLDRIDTAGEGYILHGHCMGALLAFEAVKLIEAAGAPLPRFMVASGRNAPGHVNAWLRRVPRLDDRALFEELKDLGGIPRGLSFAMAQNFLTILRNDQAMLQAYDPGQTHIGVPILALAGRDDRMTNAPGLSAWQDYTSRSLSVEWLDGEHYFIFDQADRVARHVEDFRRSVEGGCGTAESVTAT